MSLKMDRIFWVQGSRVQASRVQASRLCVQSPAFPVCPFLAKVFSCEFCEMCKNTFFIEHLQATAFVGCNVGFEAGI